MNQRTVASQFEIKGKGLHSGRPVTMVVEEAPENSGILFQRCDLPDAPPLKVGINTVVDVQRCTALGNESFRIGTVEHFLAAAYGLGIDNLRVRIDSDEMPALDGSSKVFCEFLLRAGSREQHEKKRLYGINTPYFVSRGNALVIALPSDTLKITGIFESSHPLVSNQIFEYEVEPESFTQEMAPARTFCFWEEVKGLWEQNLGLGGDFDNAVVIKEDGFSSPLRFENEMVRHKCLDLLGDLALLGRFLCVHLISIRAGHSANIEMVKLLDGSVAETGVIV